MLTPAHVDLYCRMKADPIGHAGYNVEAALIFLEKIEMRLQSMDEVSRKLLILQGMGYTQREASAMAGLSLRTASRRMHDVFVPTRNALREALDWMAA